MLHRLIAKNILLSFVFGSVPGTLLVYRYAPNFNAATLIGLALMEIAPYCIITLIEGHSFSCLIFGFLILYSIYEVGYFHNDLISNNETIGSTHRSHMSNIDIKVFFIFRIIAIYTLLKFADIVNIEFINLIILMISIFVVFLIHNKVKGYEFRIITFLLLNVGKILFRIYLISPSLLFYWQAAIPHIIVKLIHYIKSKINIVELDDSKIRKISMPIYISFLSIFLLIDNHIFLVSIPYFINHNKFNIYYELKNLLFKYRNRCK